MNPVISIVSPVYNAETLIPELIRRIELELSQSMSSFEIILVEDGAVDQSWKEIEKVCARNPQIRGIRLARNFGQHAAIMAGLQAAKGEWIVVMDCDLQDRPEEITKLYDEARKGFDIVMALRINRQDGFWKRVFSRLFYKLLSYLTDTSQDYRIANFGIYHRRCIEAVLAMREPFKFFPVMIRWVGFRRTTVCVEHAARPEGKSNYKFKQLVRIGTGLATSYSDKPLRLTVKLGLLMSAVAFSLGAYYFIRFLRGEIIVLGYASLIISIWFLCGLIIFVLGILALYLASVLESTKSRPVYLIQDTRNISS